MKIIMTDKEHLNTKHIYYSDLLNVWLKNNNDKDIINIKNKDNEIYMFSNKKYKIIDEKNITKTYDSIALKINNKYTLYNEEEDKTINIYVLDDIDKEYKKLRITNNEKIIIASKQYEFADIIIKNDDNFGKLTLIKNKNYFEIQKEDFKYDIYKENNILTDNKIKNGDLIFINGIILSILNDLLVVCYNQNNITYTKNNLSILEFPKSDYNEYIKNIDILENNKQTSFKRVPKIQRKIEKKIFNIDGPGNQELKNDTPIIYTILPMMMMSMTSLVSLVNVIDEITMGKRTIEESIPSLITVGCMLGAMALIPIITNSYRKRRQSKREIKRIEEYKEYIYEKKRLILAEIDFQKKILCENYRNTLESKEIIENLNNILWDRKKGTEDFLNISLGTGKKVPQIELRAPEEHFTIDKDKLRIQIEKLQKETEFMNDVPITFNFYKNNVTSFIGNNDLIHNYIKSFLLRIFSSYSYEDLKIVIFTNKKNKNFWEQYLNLPYIWNNEKNFRFFAYDSASYTRVVNFIDEEYRMRESLNEDDFKELQSYLIFIDDINKIKNIPVINEIMKNSINFGFTIIFNTTKMDLLPSDCKNFIYIEKNEGKAISNKDNNYEEETFIPDIIDEDFTKCYKTLSNLYLDSFEKKFDLPNKYGFLEMYDADNIEFLNIDGRWNNNSITDSLSVPIGIDDSGEIVNLNVHENAHGPHGLVAGMTGSGKSELLITYILSLAVNYSPQEVQFVLIDYKGGGLANTFYNSNVGMTLPHVVGVITNINENEINRSLISLNSEIKRRQKLFAKASLKYNEGNIDIYKYETLYKRYKDIESLSHLFIISDEFAELKAQNPEFIKELISIARIGRSLGVHLILSTQKPSGVVDDQIWSNSRFKICLKVQDKSDSNDMIKVPDAAMLKESGRFYLQVGYNELFIKGQSAYTGVEYINKDNSKRKKDEKIDFVNEYGKIYYSIDNKVEVLEESKGKEITNLVKYIIELSEKNNYSIKGLWREQIPEKIYYPDLIQKYKYIKNNAINCIIGEYDAPSLQKKDLATINLTGNGNTIIYGNLGSGKEMLLEAMIYSLIDNYTPNEINIYIMDFGSEVLSEFRNAPQVGDVIYINDKEKIINSFKLFNKILDSRKKLLLDYNGEILNYNNKNQKKLPIIVVFINIIEILFENYDNLTDTFLQLTRECNRYGISFVITTNGTNNVRTKLIQGFKQPITLELKDKYEYTSILGNKVDTKPNKYKGRGLININGVYEFQTLTISQEKDKYEAIEEKIESQINLYDKVLPIPTLPEVVSYNLISKELKNNAIIPIGINVDTLEITKFDFVYKRGIIITSMDVGLTMNFYNSLEKNILSFNNNKLFVFNSYKKYKNINNANIINNDYEKYLKQLKEFANTTNNSDIINYICFIGIYDIFTTFNINFKKEFNNILKILNDKDNFALLFIDSSTNIKKLEFEEFYRNNINNSNGIWIGNGINEQMLFKYGRLPKEYRENITSKYGFIIENGLVYKVKLIDYNGGNNEK